MDLTGLTEATIKRLERIKELKKCDDITAIQYSITVGWLTAEKQEQKKRINASPLTVISFENHEERIERGGYNPAVEGPESRK